MSSRRTTKWIQIWNQKIHIYTGLYLLLFVWLFSISGLIKNHPKWRFVEFWSKREETSLEQPIQIPTVSGDLAKARDIMQQLDISGEITWMETHPAEDQFDFRVTRPSKIIDIRTNLREKLAKVEQIKVNTWGVINMLHLFTGVRMDDPRQSRDWLMTKLWSFSMDATCAGLIFLVLSGIYIWYCRKERRLLGWLVLGAAVLTCGFFIFGLGWMP